ncbi:MAG: hypothetical protein ACMG50_08295 [Thermomonas sp.]
MPNKSASAFPAGKYQHGDTVIAFNADGTYLGTTVSGHDWVKGTYANNGSRFTVTDTWESDDLVSSMGKSCLGMKGRYDWVVTGSVMTASVVDDPCDGRKAGTDGVAWTRME